MIGMRFKHSETGGIYEVIEVSVFMSDNPVDDGQLSVAYRLVDATGALKGPKFSRLASNFFEIVTRPKQKFPRFAPHLVR